jgi:hypothetical protein
MANAQLKKVDITAMTVDQNMIVLVSICLRYCLYYIVPIIWQAFEMTPNMAN